MKPSSPPPYATVFAGVPAVNNALYHQIRFAVGDPAALVMLSNHDGSGTEKRILILRDIEMSRARAHAVADEIACPADYAPEGGLSGDRETATAQALAECLARHKVRDVRADRTLPLIFADEILSRAMELECDRDLGVRDRRQKDEQEIAWLREAQNITEQSIEMACRMIGKATASNDGTLIHDGSPLTAERVRSAIDVWLLDRGYGGSAWIVAAGSEGGDCHNIGTGILRTGQPVIIDVFPRDRSSRYHGDCTRTVVHGDVPSAIAQMHAAVVEAKAAAIAACRAGVTGESVHAATCAVITAHGYAMGLPPKGASDDFCSMPHGTGHGIGLDVHEPPLLDQGGPLLLVGDAITIEPGLYSHALGGIRVEDMVIVTEAGCDNLNTLPEGLNWG